MRMSFKYKFIFSFVLLEIVFLSLIGLFNFNVIIKNHHEYINYEKESLLTFTEQLIRTPLSIYDLATIDNISNELSKFPTVVAIEIFDHSDNLISLSMLDKKYKINYQMISKEISVDDIVIGKFNIYLDYSLQKSIIIDDELKVLYMILIQIVLSTLLAWYIGHKIASNLNSLSSSADLLKNDLNTKIPQFKGEHEIEILSSRLEEMRVELLKDRKELEQYKNIIDENVIVTCTDLNGKITYVSEAFCNNTGYKKSEILGKLHNIIKHEDMNSNFYKKLWKTIRKNEVWHGEIKNYKKDGSSYWVEANIYPMFDINNNKTGYFSVKRDITNTKILEKISITDSLTEIYNRRYFDEVFPKVINGSKRENKLLCFIILDIDYFKQYNDTYGHQMGDNVLKKVANNLKKTLKRANDLCFRLGGEEFGVLFNSLNKEKAINFANKIRQNIEELHIEHNKNTVSSYVTISLGLVCVYANDIDNTHDIYKNADELLYKAKAMGRNQVVYSNQDIKLDIIS